MTQENYQEDTQNLIRRVQQTMGGTPILDLTNWQSPRYISGDYQTRSLTNPPTLPNACHSIEVKTTVDGQTDKCPILVESSIVICTTAVPGTCPVDALVACPAGNTISTTTYVNMLAVFSMGAAQPGISIIFKYLVNGVPTQTTVIWNATLGLNHVYAFANNQIYPADTSLVLYGAEVLA